MKIIALGDPHGSEKIKKIPFAKIRPDLILCPGDLGKADLARKRAFENVERKKNGLKELKYDGDFAKRVYNEIRRTTLNVVKFLNKNAQTYTLIGNVGRAIFSDYQIRKEGEKYNIKHSSIKKELKLLKNFHLERNKLRNINGLRIGFLEYFIDNSWIKEFGEKDKRRIKKAKTATAKAKRILERWGPVDILVCHQPPYGVLDEVTAKFAPKHWQGKHAGSKVILDYVKKYQPRYVVCGHIHEGKGKMKVGKTEVINAGMAGDYFVIDIN